MDRRNSLEKRLRLVVDITPISSLPKTGIGRILESLIDQLRLKDGVQLVCFTITARGYLPKLKKQYPELRAPSIPARFSKKALEIAKQVSLPIDLFTGRADAAISVDWLCLPLLSGKTVAVVADVTPITDPQWHKSETIKLFTQRIRMIEKNADVVVAISQATKKELAKHTKMEKGKIIVAYPGVPKSFKVFPSKVAQNKAKSKYQLPDEFLLFVGTQEPRKNLPNLIEAFSFLEKKVKLVVAGDKGWGKETSFPTFVQELGYVPEEELTSVFVLSRSVVFPSLKEGFGLPIVEAFAMGIPVLTSNTSSMKEIANDAAILVDPYSVDDITRGLEEMLTISNERRKKLIAAGKRRLKKYSFEKMVDDIIKEIGKSQ